VDFGAKISLSTSDMICRPKGQISKEDELRIVNENNKDK
jgi:hypothetical protein